MTGYRIITDNASTPNIIGLAIDETSGGCAAGFQFEQWCKVSGGCGPNSYAWAHWLIPFCRYGVLGDWTFQLDSLMATVMASTQHSYVYGSGPFNQWTPAPGTTEHVMFQYTNVNPPADTGGYAPLTIGTATPVAA
jgi:hypothetical protein